LKCNVEIGSEWQQKEREKGRHLDRSFVKFVGHRLVPGRPMMAEGGAATWTTSELPNSAARDGH
jgi:hypothetical protein